MQDAVGEVLAQRRALDRGAGAGIVFSLFLHGIIVAAAVVAALRHPQQESVNIIDIKFARMPAPAVEAPPKPAAEAAAATPRPAPKPQPVVEAPPKPAAKPAPAKTVPFSPYGKSTKKGAEPLPQPATSEIPVGGTGAVVEGDFPYTIYIDRMKNLIGQHWFRPQVGAGATATVFFVIDRDGTIRDAKSETASGDGTFDRAALRAVIETSPLPPLPFGYSGTYLNVHLTFK